jgi:phosphonate transport system ATP-binding protein
MEDTSVPGGPLVGSLQSALGPSIVNTPKTAGNPDCSLRGVIKAYAGRRVLDGISLELFAGQRVALIGPSGAGKTTLLRVIAGIIHPEEGQVVTLGIDTASLHGASLRRLRKQVGFLYQNDNLIPSLRVAHNVLLGKAADWSVARSLLSLLWPQEVDVAARALDRMELGHKLWALPGTLSGGEQQRVAIARLLVQQPKLTLADEPVSALDVRLGREIIRLLTTIATEQGSTLLASLHALDLLGPHFDRVIALRDGSVVWDGPPALITQRILRDVYGAEYESLKLSEITVGSAGA